MVGFSHRDRRSEDLEQSNAALQIEALLGSTDLCVDEQMVLMVEGKGIRKQEMVVMETVGMDSKAVGTP